MFNPNDSQMETENKTQGSPFLFNQPWKLADMRQVRELFLSGVRIPEIAERVRRSDRAVRIKLMGMGELNGYLGRDGMAWETREDDRLLRFFSQGYNVQEIAGLMGRRKKDIQKRIQFLCEAEEPFEVPA